MSRRSETRKCSCGGDIPKDWTRCLVCKKVVQVAAGNATAAPQSTQSTQSRASWADLSEQEMLGLANGYGRNGPSSGWRIGQAALLMYPVDGNQDDSAKQMSAGGSLTGDGDGFWLPSLTSSSASAEAVAMSMCSSSDRSSSSDAMSRIPSGQFSDAGSRRAGWCKEAENGQLPSCDLDLLAEVPRNSEGEVTSVGSIGHFEGKCSPCVYWFKGVCSRGVTCRQCHFIHDGQKGKRLRPSKHTRQRMRSEALDGNKEPCSEGACPQSPKAPAAPSGASASGAPRPGSAGSGAVAGTGAGRRADGDEGESEGRGAAGGGGASGDVVGRTRPNIMSL
mmetsp:Transcript_36323/g.104375  ORF Transcript_36323/g.104375 Transcript_36323/m.104375 type:complete len:335 (+) Transcript_36323:75-1079(+)